MWGKAEHRLWGKAEHQLWGKAEHRLWGKAEHRLWGKAERMEAPWEPSRMLVVGGEDHTLANNAHLLTVQPPVAMATITAQ